jgi:hypothetical protein
MTEEQLKKANEKFLKKIRNFEGGINSKELKRMNKIAARANGIKIRNKESSENFAGVVKKVKKAVAELKIKAKTK